MWLSSRILKFSTFLKDIYVEEENLIKREDREKSEKSQQKSDFMAHSGR